MVDKIFEKYNELKAILTEFNQREKSEPEKFIEEVKTKITEFLAVFEEEKTEPEA